MRKYSSRRRAVFRFSLILVSCLTVLIVTRHRIAGCIASGALHYLFPKHSGVSIGYSSAKWEGSVISISGVEIDDPTQSIHIESVELALGWQPHLFVIHPVLRIQSPCQEEPKQRTALPLTFLRVLKMDVLEGKCTVLPFQSGNREESFCFSLESQDSKGLKFTCYEEIDRIDRVFLEAFAHWQSDELSIGVAAKTITSDELVALSRLLRLPFLDKLELSNGSWEGYLQGALNHEGTWVGLSGQISAEGVVLRSILKDWAFEAGGLKLVLASDGAEAKKSWYHNLGMDATLVGGAFHLYNEEKAYHFRDLTGNFSCQKASEPTFHLEGNLVLNDCVEKVLAFGLGQIEETGGCCFKSQVLLGDKESAVAIATMQITGSEEADHIIDINVERAELPFLKRLSDTLGWTAPWMFSATEGKVAGACQILIHQGVIHSLEVKPTTVAQATLKKEAEFQATSMSLQFGGNWDVSKAHGWKIREFNAQVFSGDIDLSGFKQLRFQKMSGEVVLREEDIEQGSIKTLIEGIPLEIVLSGAWQRPNYQIYTSTTWMPLMHVLSSLGLQVKDSYLGEELVECVCECRAYPENYVVNAQLNIEGEGTLESQCDIKEDEVQNGTIKLSSFPLAPLLSIVTKEFDGKGRVDLEGKFDSHGGNALFTLNEMELQTKDLALDMLVTSNGQLTWGPQGSDINIRLPLRTAQCSFKNIELSLEKLSALFVATSEGMYLKDLEACCSGIQFKGDVEIHEQKVTVVSQEIQGNLIDLRRLLAVDSKFPQLPRGIQGRFLVKNQGFHLELPSASLALHVLIENAFIPIGNLGALDRVVTEFIFDSTDSKIGLTGLRGDLHLANKMCFHLELQPFMLYKQQEDITGDLEATLDLGTSRIAHCLGQLKLSSKENTFELLSSKSQLFGTALHQGKFKVRPDGMGCYLSGSFKLEELASIKNLLNTAQIVAFQGALPSISGEVAYTFNWDSYSNLLDTTLRSKQLHIEGNELNHVLVHCVKEPRKLDIKEFIWNDCKASAEIFLDRPSEYPFSYTVCNPLWKSTGEGSIYPSQYVIRCLPQLDVMFSGKGTLSFKSKSPCSIDYSRDQQIFLTGSKWEEPITHSTIEISKAIWNPVEKKTDVDGIAFCIADSLVKQWAQEIKLPSKWLEGTAHFTHSTEGFEVTGALQDGEYGWLKHTMPCKVLQWRLIPKTFLLGAKLELGEIASLGTVQIDLVEKLALFKLQQQGSNGVLNMLVRGLEGKTPLIERFHGDFVGIHADLRNIGKEKTLLRGRVDMDFKELSRLLSPKTQKSWQRFKAGKGYTFEGDIAFKTLDDWRIEGKFLGNHFELFNFELSEVVSHIQASPKKILLKQLQLNDGEFHLAIPSFALEEVSEQSWHLNCPLIQVKDLQPSRLQLLGEKNREIKPFVIRHLTMSDLRGRLGDSESFSGDCILRFTNMGSKKESNIFDIPRNILKDLGLEPSLLVPIQGELLGVFEGGKLLFRELKNSYSEGKRTQFALSGSGEGSYIDFDGKLHIDLVMRQMALLKIIESLTLGIRGNLEKPRYLLLP
ncbi:MAG: hypothetical protein KGZ39_00550 [Simkania sp.]|nr:hypothetical protein [Simkania sp.]